LIVGANGNLGRYITKYCLERENLRVHILDKNLNNCESLRKMIEQKGGNIIQGDLTDSSIIKGCTKGIHTLISVLDGDERIVFDAEMALLEDGINNGLRRFVPADFTINLKKIKDTDDPFLDYSNRFRTKVMQSNVKLLSIFSGLFMETFFKLCSKDICYWGDENMLLDLTACEDVGKFVALAISDPNKIGEIRIAGNEVSPVQIAETIKKVTGQSVGLCKKGEIDDLKKTAMELKKKGDLREALKYFYAVHAFDGTGKLFDLHNKEFNMNFTSLEDYISSHRQELNF